MDRIACFFLGLVAGILGMWSSQNLERSGCFLLGVVCGIVLVLVFIWMLVKTVKSNAQEQEHQDEWWKRGDPPPWEK